MSFSSDVKKEICSVEQFDREALKAELYGMLLFSRNFSPNKITFTTESNYAGNRLIFLLQNLYMPIIEKQSALRTKSSDSHLYKIIVVDGNDCKRIFEDFGHTDGQITLRVNRADLSSEELSQAFLRGVFLCQCKNSSFRSCGHSLPVLSAVWWRTSRLRLWLK